MSFKVTRFSLSVSGASFVKALAILSVKLSLRRLPTMTTMFWMAMGCPFGARMGFEPNLAKPRRKMQVHERPKRRCRSGVCCARLYFVKPRSNHRIPCGRDQPVFGAVFFDMADRGEGEVKAHHERLLGCGHVVEFVPSCL